MFDTIKNLALCILLSVCFVLGMRVWVLEKKREELLAHRASLESSLKLQNATLKANEIDLEQYRSSLNGLREKIKSSYSIKLKESCEERLQEAQRAIGEFLEE